MGEPVIIDDGGSTRIRQVQKDSQGNMDSLFEVKGLVNGKRGSEHEISVHKNDLPYSTIQIQYQDEKGQINALPAINQFARILISSEFGQHVQVDKIGNGSNIRLTIFGDLVDPNLESKQHKGKRRYIVSNSGQIEKITVTDQSNATNDVFDTSQPGAPGSAGYVVYTNVTIT